MVYAGIVLKKNKRILFQFRDNNKRTRNLGTWGIFGGGVKKNEDPKQAVIREIKEELGVTLHKKDVKLLVETNFRGELVFIFESDFSYILSNLKLREGSDSRFFSKREILKLKNTVPGLKKFVGEL